MPNSEQLKILRLGREIWNKWRTENPEIEIDLTEAFLTEDDLRFVNLTAANLYKADLSGADLSGANFTETCLIEAILNQTDLTSAEFTEADLASAQLIEADLRYADLSGADFTGADLTSADLTEADLASVQLIDAYLRCANLTRADLTGADLSGANLSEVNLTGAHLENSQLIGVNMSRASLVLANLSDADISGSIMNDVNTSRWIIKGIKCTHIFRNDKRVDYEEGEFEKAFTQIEKVVEMIIAVPFSDLTYYIGRFIENAVNKKFGEESLMLTTQQALSNDITKYEYISFREEDKLGEIKNILAILQKDLKSVIENAKSKTEPQPVLQIKEKIDLKFLPIEISTKELNRVFIEAYNQSPLLQRIFHTIQSVIQ